MRRSRGGHRLDYTGGVDCPRSAKWLAVLFVIAVFLTRAATSEAHPGDGGDATSGSGPAPKVSEAAPPPKAGGAPPPPPENVAIAQALYDTAMSLMSEGRYAEACPKLEESLRLDQGLGTRFHLAECHENLGRTASAWAEFLQVAQLAKADGQLEREQVAREHAQAVEGRVPRLKIVVDTRAHAGTLRVLRDGRPISPAEWNTAIPVDPGDHRILARTKDGGRLERHVQLPPRAETIRVEIPPAAAFEYPNRHGKRDEGGASKGRGQRTLGAILAGAGAVTLGVGGYFGVRALMLRSDSNSQCVGTTCTTEGAALREDAIAAADAATIAVIAGGALLTGGAIVYFAAPSPTPRASAQIGASPTGVWIGGSF